MEQRPNDQQSDYEPDPYEPTRSRSGAQGPQYPQDPYASQAPYATGPQPYQGPAYPQPGPPPKKKRGAQIAGLGCAGAFAIVVIIVVATAVSGSKTGNTAGTGTGTPPATVSTTVAGQGVLANAATTAAAPAAPAKKVVLTKSGEGIEQTRAFTVGDDWSLTYSFNCSNFGMQGNFQVYEDYPSGDVLVNALAKSGSDVTYQTGDAGTHSLKINSECAWTVKVTDGDTGQ
jgi:hypothetical protein